MSCHLKYRVNAVNLENQKVGQVYGITLNACRDPLAMRVANVSNLPRRAARAFRTSGICPRALHRGR